LVGSKGKRTIKIVLPRGEIKRIFDILYVPSLTKKNKLSISSISDKGFVIILNFKCVYANQIEHVEFVKVLNVGFHLISNIINIIRLWGKRLGHLNFRGLHFQQISFSL